MTEFLPDLFRELRAPSVWERRHFGPFWLMDESEIPPHGEWVLCAIFPGEGDGHMVVVFRAAMPAVFYRLEVEGWGPVALETGTGQAPLVKAMARAISTGMLGLSQEGA